MKVYLLDTITADMARNVIQQIDQADGGPIEVVIFSDGGSVVAGNAIIQALKSYTGHVTTNVIGLASSMAAIISQVGDDRFIAPDASFNVHNAEMPPTGRQTKEAHLDAADTLAVLDARMAAALSKSYLDENGVLNLMKQDRLIGADEAIALGFFDGYSEPVQAVAHLNQSINMTKLSQIMAQMNVAAIKLGLAKAELTEDEAARLAVLEAIDEPSEEEAAEMAALKEKAAAEAEAVALEGAELEEDETGAEILTSDMVSREEFDTFRNDVNALLEQILAAVEIVPSEEQMIETVAEQTTAKLDNVLRAIKSKTTIPTAQQHFATPEPPKKGIDMSIIDAKVNEIKQKNNR